MEPKESSAARQDVNFARGFVQSIEDGGIQALEEFQKAIELGGENPTLIADKAFVHVRLGELEPAHEILARLEGSFPRPHSAASSVARIYFALGERDKSNTWLEEAFESRDAMLPWACSDSRYEDLWTLPALSAFRERVMAEPVR
jgi:tetratricopeptide (TPR) repeat protein